MDPVFSNSMRLSLALLFAAAAMHKARDLSGFTATLGDHRIVPGAFVALLAPVLVAAEVVLAATLLVPSLAQPASLAAAVLLGLYSAAIAINLARGRRHIDCGCFGPARSAGSPELSGALLTRNAVLVGAALLASLPAVSRSLSWVDAVSIGGGVLLASLLFQAASGLLLQAPASRRLRVGNAS